MADEQEYILPAPIVARAWEDEAFRAALLRDPRGTLRREYGIEIPVGLQIEILEEKADTSYLVIPPDPTASGDDTKAQDQVLRALDRLRDEE
jgi:hypothetical protein